MRPVLVLLLGLCASLSAGCSMLNDGKESIDATADAFTPRSHDRRDDINGVNGQTFNDEWSGVGKEGRGTEAREREWDGLTKYTMSPKAQAIERNLGYGY